MSIKKEKVNITYDAIWLKIFMDSDELSMYGKEVFVTKDIGGDKNILLQMIGNVGGFARMDNFDKDIILVIFSDNILNRLKNGDKDPFIQQVEDLINGSNTPYRKLIFTSETLVLDYFKTRATGRLNQDKKDSKSRSNSPELNQILQDSIKEDKVMIDMLKKYSDSTNKGKQAEMF